MSPPRYSIRLNNSDSGFTASGASGTQSPLTEFDTSSLVSPLANPMFSLMYMASGFLGLQTVVNEFFTCNEYVDLSKAGGSNLCCNKV